MFKLEDTDKNMIASLVGTIAGNHLKTVDEADFRNRARAEIFLNIAFDLSPYLTIDPGHVFISEYMRAGAAIDAVAILLTFVKFWDVTPASVLLTSRAIVPDELLEIARRHHNLKKHLNFRRGEARQRKSPWLNGYVIHAYNITETLLTDQAPRELIEGEITQKEIRRK